MICPNCKANVSENEKACPSCGTYVAFFDMFDNYNTNEVSPKKTKTLMSNKEKPISPTKRNTVLAFSYSLAALVLFIYHCLDIDFSPNLSSFISYIGADFDIIALVLSFLLPLLSLKICSTKPANLEKKETILFKAAKILSIITLILGCSLTIYTLIDAYITLRDFFITG